MSCRRALAVFMVLLLLGLVGVHEWFLLQLKGGLQDSLRRESGYPVRIDSFRGFLPTGSIWVKGLEFKTHLSDQTSDSIEWRFPTGSLDVRLIPLFRARYAVDSVSAPNLEWEARLPTLRGEFRGYLSLEGASSSPVPEGLLEETIWCERVSATLTGPTGSWEGKSLELPPRTHVEVENFNLLDGAPVLPLAFDIRSELTDRPEGPLFLGSGTQDQTDASLRSDLRLVGVSRADLLRLIRTAVTFDPQSAPFQQAARDWIEAGSMSLRLVSHATPQAVSGEVTLRVQGPKFGEAVKEEEIAGQSVRPFLEAFERRTDTIEIGPLAFREDLTTPRTEAFDQMQGALVGELVRNAPEAALRTGAGMLKNFFRGD